MESKGNGNGGVESSPGAGERSSSPSNRSLYRDEAAEHYRVSWSDFMEPLQLTESWQRGTDLFLLFIVVTAVLFGLLCRVDRSWVGSGVVLRSAGSRASLIVLSGESAVPGTRVVVLSSADGRSVTFPEGVVTARARRSVHDPSLAGILSPVAAGAGDSVEVALATIGVDPAEPGPASSEPAQGKSTLSPGSVWRIRLVAGRRPLLFVLFPALDRAAGEGGRPLGEGGGTPGEKGRDAGGTPA